MSARHQLFDLVDADGIGIHGQVIAEQSGDIVLYALIVPRLPNNVWGKIRLVDVPVPTDS
jgi:hypothetical protein